MIETALLIPLLLLLVFNAINFGYYFIVGLHLASAPREGVEYSILGFATPATLTLAAPGPSTNEMTVSYLTYRDMRVLAGTSTTPVRVCSKVLGVTNAGTTSQRANCQVFPSTAVFSDPDATFVDPEAPHFVLHRVEVQYDVSPLIPGSPFGINVLPSYTFHRQVSMRAID